MITKDERDYIVVNSPTVCIAKTKNKYFVEETAHALNLLQEFRNSKKNSKNLKKGKVNVTDGALNG